jgi:hypothetical protein
MTPSTGGLLDTTTGELVIGNRVDSPPGSCRVSSCGSRNLDRKG